MIKKYDPATTPYHRAVRDDGVSAEDKNILADTYTDLNPAATQREIQALTTQLLTLTTGKAVPRPGLGLPAPPTRASGSESTKIATRAS